MNTSTRLLPLLVLFVASALLACSAQPSQCITIADCRPGQACLGNVCTSVDAGDAHNDGSMNDIVVDTRPACEPGTACPGGVCVAGQCCASANACGDSCCGAGQQCFANACVMPGALCTNDAECGSGSYCEPALGPASSGDGGVGDAGTNDGGARDAAMTCILATGTQGRCLPRVPLCPAGSDGGVGDGGTACISACEFHPPAGHLDSTLLWSWGQPTAPREYPGRIDVWSTPAIGRFYDANCDGNIDSLDPPNVIFVSGRSVDVNTGLGTCCQCTNATPSACQTGALRVLDGRTGADLLTVRAPSATSSGFAGVSVAIGDLDRDRHMDIAAVTGEGYVVIIDHTGRIVQTSDQPIPGHSNAAFGWGGGLAIADMDHDGSPEIVFGNTVFTTAGGSLHLRFTGAFGAGGGGVSEYLSTLADVDGTEDGFLELVAGNTVYRQDGTVLWHRADLPDGFPGVADLDMDGQPDVVLVSGGQVWVLNAATGVTTLGPVTLPGMGFGGAPTIADFNRATPGPEIGIAQANFYSVLDPDYTTHTIHVLWSAANHDLSSSVTGSTVFDFDGDGQAEVLYADECYVWVFDGATGQVRWAGLTTSFTGTEASVVADVDGDGHAEIIVVSNGADPGPSGWRCNAAPWNTPDTTTGRPAWVPPTGAVAYQGVRVYRDAARSWVGTRSMWNQHTYHVSNVCVPGDDACEPGSYEGQIPLSEHRNWQLPWLNNFRQNVQQAGLFSAPDATVTLVVSCSVPPVLTATVRNLGEAILPAGVTVGFFVRGTSGDTMIGMGTTTTALFPGAVQQVTFTTAAGTDTNSAFIARIIVDPAHPGFHECRTDNNESAPVRAPCPG